MNSLVPIIKMWGWLWLSLQSKLPTRVSPSKYRLLSNPKNWLYIMSAEDAQGQVPRISSYFESILKRWDGNQPRLAAEGESSQKTSIVMSGNGWFIRAARSTILPGRGSWVQSLGTLGERRWNADSSRSKAPVTFGLNIEARGKYGA